MTPFRHHHLLLLLEIFEEKSLPLDRSIHDYFKTRKALGSKDRAFVAETAFALLRWRVLLDHLTPEPHTWENRLNTFLNGYTVDPSWPAHIKCSFPKVLYDLIEESWGKEAEKICAISNTQAPITLRVNTLKTNRETLLQCFPDAVAAKTPTAIHIQKRIPVFTIPEFQQGFFEMQDEASQLIASLVEVKPGQHVLDYCAGSGGKTLAFAPAMQQKGQIYLHDVRPQILVEAKRRLKRAGVQNAQILTTDKLNPIKKKCDWVLVDAPCTGTGTLRRNPDMKDKITPEMLKRLIGEQRNIFEKALSFLKPGGRIVYATCSILKPENEMQVEHFIKTYNLKLEKDPLQIMPEEGGMDGFFGAVLSKNPES